MSDEKKNFIIIKPPNELNYYICDRCRCEWVAKREDNYSNFHKKHYCECPGCGAMIYETLSNRLDESQLEVLDKLIKDPELFETDIFKEEETLEDKAADIIFKNNGGEAFEEMCKSDCRGPSVTCVHDLKDAVNYKPAKTTCDGEPVQNLTDRFKPYPTDSMRITDPHEDLILDEEKDFTTWLLWTAGKCPCDLTIEELEAFNSKYIEEKTNNG